MRMRKYSLRRYARNPEQWERKSLESDIGVPELPHPWAWMWRTVVTPADTGGEWVNTKIVALDAAVPGKCKFALSFLVGDPGGTRIVRQRDVGSLRTYYPELHHQAVLTLIADSLGFDPVHASLWADAGVDPLPDQPTVAQVREFKDLVRFLYGGDREDHQQS
jgi:hypothetical protein